MSFPTILGYFETIFDDFVKLVHPYLHPQVPKYTQIYKFYSRKNPPI